MANNITTNPRLWILDTVEAVKAADNKVFIRLVHFFPTTASDEMILSEYASDGSTTQKIIHLMATSGATIDPVERTYDPPIECNGLYLATLTHGSVEVTIDKVDPQL